jgi:hypothetical protein
MQVANENEEKEENFLFLGDERHARRNQVKAACCSHRMLGAGTDNTSAYPPLQVKVKR